MTNKQVAFLAIIFLAWQAFGATEPHKDAKALNATRAPHPVIGGSATTRIAVTTSTDGDSGELSDDTVYSITCESDAWLVWGASAVTAVADDFLLFQGERFYFLTGGPEGVRHVSALSRTANGDCHIMEYK